MKADQLLTLLGSSIKSSGIVSIMSALDMNIEPDTKIDRSGDIYQARFKNIKQDFEIGFSGYHRYLRSHGQPLYIENKESDELILTDIHYNSNFRVARKWLNVQMPFGLLLGDDKDDVCLKINKKAKEKSKCPWGYAWYFHHDEFYIITRFNDSYKLLGLSVYKYELSDKKKIELSKSINKQKKNIKPENSEAALELGKKLPTLEWINRKNSGDDIFTIENIQSIDEILKDYLVKMYEYTLAKNNRVIYSSVKKLVISINKINEKHDFFIESMEREELCEFIHTVVRKTGFEFESNIDLTEEWRKW
jgi:hypothetical protein